MATNVGSLQLLQPLIQKNAQRHDKIKSSNPLFSGAITFQNVISTVQTAINKRIEDLNARDEQYVPFTDWTQEKSRRQNLFSHLKHESALQFCREILENANKQYAEIMQGPTEHIKKRQEHLFKETETTLGEAVFIGQFLPIDAQVKFDAIYVEQNLKAEMQKITQQLANYKNKIAPFNFQDVELIYCLEKAKLIASLLLTPQGQINFGMNDTIAKYLFDTEITEYDQKLLDVLGQIDASWQIALDTVELPKKGNLVSEAIIRADLQLKSEVLLKPIHCKVEVLQSLLVQGCSLSKCFGVACAIKKHKEFLDQTMKDYQVLLGEGFLLRNLQGMPNRFFFEMSLADVAMSTQFTLQPDGIIPEYQNASFRDCPNFENACFLMGFTNDEYITTDLLQTIFADSQVPQQMTWDTLLQKSAEVIANKNGKSKEDLLAFARYGFSLTGNRLQRAWETSIAARSETNEGDIRDKINSSVMNVVDKIFENSKKNYPDAYRKTVVAEISQIFQRTLNSSYKLIYNDAITGRTLGGFELYQRNVEDVTKGIRIATPQEFQRLVGEVIKKIQPLEKDRVVFESVKNALILCVYGKNFSGNVLHAYDEQNRSDPDPVAHYQHLSWTPMTTLDTQFEAKILESGLDFIPDVRTIRPKDPADLLKWVLNLARWKISTDDANTQGDFFGMDFQSFKEFLESGMTADVWIEQGIVASGQKISQSVMDEKVKANCEQELQKLFPKNTEIGELLKQLNQENLTVQQYSQRLYKGLVYILKYEPKKAYQFSYLFDEILLKSLPPLQIAPFVKQESSDLCFFFNPRTEAVDFGEITNGTLKRKDQWEWKEGFQV